MSSRSSPRSGSSLTSSGSSSGSLQAVDATDWSGQPAADGGFTGQQPRRLLRLPPLPPPSPLSSSGWRTTNRDTGSVTDTAGSGNQWANAAVAAAVGAQAGLPGASNQQAASLPQLPGLRLRPPGRFSDERGANRFVHSRDDTHGTVASDHMQRPADGAVLQHSGAAAASSDAELLRRLDGVYEARRQRASGGDAAFGAPRPASARTHEHPSGTLSRMDSRETIDAIVPHLMERAERRLRLGESAGRAEAAAQALLISSPPQGGSGHLTAQMLHTVLGEHGSALGSAGRADALAAGLEDERAASPAAASPELSGRWVAQPLPHRPATATVRAGQHPRGPRGGAGAGAAHARSSGSDPWSRPSEAETSPAGSRALPTPAASALQLRCAATSLPDSPASSVGQRSFERQPLQLQSGDNAAEQSQRGWQPASALRTVRFMSARAECTLFRP